MKSTLKTNLALAIIALVFSACGDKPQAPPPQTDPLFKAQRDALEKARGVEQTEAQHVEDLKKEEERQTQ